MSLFEKFKAAVAPKKDNQSNGGPKIWPMNPEIAAKIQRGVRCNVKVVLRGMRKTGKSALLAALHGHAYPEVYSPSKEISAATIHWQKNKDDELGAKVEIWDVVDESPDSNQNGKLLRADATTIDVYRGCHCVVFMVDCTRPETLEYVRKEAVKLPPTIALLICLNFSDHPSGAKVVSERDCDTLCNSLPRSSTATVQQCCKGQPPPRQFSASPTWINLSLRTGSGMELLWNFFNIPVNMVRLEGLETQMKLLYQDIESVQADLLTMRAQQRFEAKEREKNELIERTREREPSPVAPAAPPPVQASPVRQRDDEPGRIDQSFFAGISDDEEETQSKPQRKRLSDSEDEPKPKADSRVRASSGKSQSSSTERKEPSPTVERAKVIPTFQPTSQPVVPVAAPVTISRAAPEPPKVPEPQKIDPTPGEGGRQVDRGFFDSDEEEPVQKPEPVAKVNRRRLSDSDDEPVVAPAPRPKSRSKKSEPVPEPPEVAKVTVDISALLQGMQSLVVDEPPPAPVEKEKKRKEKSSKSKKEKKSKAHEEDDGDFEVQS
jgi:hypothetical protein